MNYNTEKEVWKDVVGYEGLYEVSSLGRVKSLRRNIIMKQKKVKGYNMLNLTKAGKQKGETVSRLVGRAFIPNPENKPQINHIDENKQNNHVDNLEWVTAKENSNHGTRTSRVINNLERTSEKQKTPIAMIDKDTGELIKVFNSIQSAFRFLGDIPNGNISRVCKKKREHAYGYKWEYI